MDLCWQHNVSALCSHEIKRRTQERPGADIAEINSKHHQFTRNQLKQANFTPYPSREKKQKWPQDKILNIPNYYKENVNQNENKKSNPI